MPTLRELREAQRWTQSDLAERVGVDRATVARWETSERWKKPPSRLARLALGRLFGVDPDVIVFGEDEKRPPGRPKRDDDD